MSDGTPAAREFPALAVFASGSGTTFQAILDAVRQGVLPMRINVLVVDRPKTGAEDRARREGVPVLRFDRGRVDRQELSRRIDAELPADTAIVMLAGYLSIVTEPLLGRFSGRILNTHPALLPRFGGAGMYGSHVHEAVLASGATVTGCTVHEVDAGTDTGAIVLQKRIPVLPGDTVTSLQERLQPVEHRAVVDALVSRAAALR